MTTFIPVCVGIPNLFEFRVSNGLVFYVLSPFMPDQFIRKQDSIHLSAIQMVQLSSIQMAFLLKTKKFKDLA